MTIRTLEEDFRRMGLSKNEIRESLSNMLGECAEADLDSDVTEEDFEEGEEGYLGDVFGEAIKSRKMHRTKSGAKAKSRKYYASHKAKIKKQKIKRAKSAIGKRAKKMLAMKPQKKGYRRQTTDTGDMYDSGSSIHESLLESINDLAQSIEHNPTGRFDEYVTAFNHIADLGELGAMKIMDEDEEAACDVIRVALEAEDVLKAMEEMDGALTVEEDELLEDLLAEAMEDIATTLETYGLFEGCKKRTRKGQDDDEEEEDEVEEDITEQDDEDEEEEDDEEDEDEDMDEDISESALMLFNAADQLREAKGGKETKRPEKTKKRMLVVGGKLKKVSTPSRWGKMNKALGASRKQIALRKDVRKPEALLGYLKKVKAGTVAPGMPSSGKSLNKGAAKAVKAARVSK